MKNTQNAYTEKGYRCRIHYLECVAADYGADLDLVFSLAFTLGEDEDFDGLLWVLQDKLD